ncbi:hypothetical protein CTheo_8763 [Ceratobasidium theobromae]|uniref:Uncharacterized protein n=1 Tax=Ceratobasidium theobromae TaxID=1582974 RepID=A0A5N5Q7T2_9AGAM|nr:hypothetical protein CTheo_8763 [Ceratobasidium theobromae]
MSLNVIGNWCTTKNHFRSMEQYLYSMPRELKRDLANNNHSSAIPCVLMSKGSRQRTTRIARDLYKHPQFGFLFWLSQDCEEGPDTLVGNTIFCWHHFILFRVSTFSDFVQWHQMGLQVEPTVCALELEIFCQAVGALQLLYPPEEQPEEEQKEDGPPKLIEVFVQEEVTVQEEPWAGLAGSGEVGWHMGQVWTGQEEHWDGWGLSPAELRDLERNGVDFEAMAAKWTGDVDN